MRSRMGQLGVGALGPSQSCPFWDSLGFLGSFQLCHSFDAWPWENCTFFQGIAQPEENLLHGAAGWGSALASDGAEPPQARLCQAGGSTHAGAGDKSQPAGRPTIPIFWVSGSCVTALGQQVGCAADGWPGKISQSTFGCPAQLWAAVCPSAFQGGLPLICPWTCF